MDSQLILRGRTRLPGNPASTKRVELYSKNPIRMRSLSLAICTLLLASFEFVNSVQAAAQAEAYVGQPFGVGRVTVDVLRGEPVVPLSDERFTILEATGRTFYPVLKQEPVRRLIRNLLDMDAPRKVSIYFLFRGDQPFDLSSFTPYEQGVRVRPIANAAAHRRLLNQWWEQYTKRHQGLLEDGSYPPVAENFLVASLSRRLGLRIPEPRRGLLAMQSDQPNPLEYLLVNEAHTLRVDREMLAEQADEPGALTELPEPVRWPDTPDAEDALEEVAIEDLAQRVPEECFYVRFGTFSNYLWFRDLNKKWQGDLGNMIRRRGIVRGANQRIQQQLSLKDNVLAKIVGPKVIGDAALIGFDPYVQQGAAIGVVFVAKNEFLLATDLQNQRRSSLTKFKDATEETLTIEGQSVSLISNPAGEVRSYHVQDGGVHLVATSRKLIERFLQASAGTKSLANLTSFRRARQRFPLERQDEMFAFVPERFWQNLSSPRYIIENARRMRSVREPVLLELAGYAAQIEAEPAAAKDQVDSSQILPANFAARTDGSERLEVDGESRDSLRGKPGYFAPIADVDIESVSEAEVALFKRFAQLHATGVGRMPPIAVALQRFPGEPGEPETITVDAWAQGLLRETLGKFATWIGQPSETRMQPIDGNLFAAEAVVELPGLLGDTEGGELHVFGALRDFRSALTVKRGAVQPAGPPAELVRGYIGSWPKPGLLRWFTNDEPAQGPDPQPVGADLWQAKQDDYLLISFKPDVINQVLPQLDRVPAERPAQVWVTLQDLTGTQMAENVNAFGYMRTRETSAAGSRMMNALANQLRVPRHQCREVAERLIDGEFVCPLGGEYQLYEPRRSLETWASTALPESNRFSLTEVPEDFQLPLLEWFRGLSGDLTLDEQGLSAHVEVKMSDAALP